MKFGDLFIVGVFGAAALAARRAMAADRKRTPAERLRELVAREGFNPGAVLAAMPPDEPPPPVPPPAPPPLVTRSRPYHTPHSRN